MAKIVECVPNISEGRRKDVIEACVDQIRQTAGVTLLDYSSYIEAKLRANAEYKDRRTFGRKCLMNIASAGKFSSDRTIRQYAEEIWHIEPTKY